MLSIYILIFVTIFIVIFLFSSPKLSPIPYFPSQPVDLPLIVKALGLKNNQTVIDLGAGDGIVIFEAAKSSYLKKFNTKFIAVEINPVLILVLYLRRFFHPNKKNIQIVKDDIFKINIKNKISKIKTTDQKLNIKTMKQLNNVTIYLYISPWFLEKTVSNIKSQISKFSVVSYMYPLKVKDIFTKVSAVKGKNKIFIYS